MIYDACNSAESCYDSEVKDGGTTELLSACGLNENTPDLAAISFTSTLNDELRKGASRPFTVSQLHCRLLERFAGSKQTLLKSPVHVVLTREKRKGLIVLQPLLKPEVAKEEPQEAPHFQGDELIDLGIGEDNQNEDAGKQDMGSSSLVTAWGSAKVEHDTQDACGKDANPWGDPATNWGAALLSKPAAAADQNDIEGGQKTLTTGWNPNDSQGTEKAGKSTQSNAIYDIKKAFEDSQQDKQQDPEQSQPASTSVKCTVSIQLELKPNGTLGDRDWMRWLLDAPEGVSHVIDVRDALVDADGNEV